METDNLLLQDQIARFKNASIIITPQGAHSINLIWSRRLKYYIEITPNCDNSITYYAKILGAKVKLVKSKYCNPDDFSSSHNCNLERLDKLLQEIQI